VWVNGVHDEVRELLQRRTDHDAVKRCIKRHAEAVASDLDKATKIHGPGDFYVLRFSCLDAGVVVPLQLIFDVISDAEVAVISCQPIAF